MSQIGYYFVLFSIRCSLSNVDDSFLFVLFFVKVIYGHDAKACKGKVPVNQLLVLPNNSRC